MPSEFGMILYRVEVAWGTDIRSGPSRSGVFYVKGKRGCTHATILKTSQNQDGQIHGWKG